MAFGSAFNCEVNVSTHFLGILVHFLLYFLDHMIVVASVMKLIASIFSYTFSFKF